MGEVYRAQDARLNRNVAIKVSSAQSSERFKREAKAIAALKVVDVIAQWKYKPGPAGCEV